jgi:hypothetical protein
MFANVVIGLALFGTLVALALACAVAFTAARLLKMG